MSRDARKKQKQRLKREQKRREAKRARALTPLDRIARSGGQLECYVNSGWREMGMASIHVLGRAPGGQLAYGAFLVDVWCVGLKDTHGRREISRLDFDDLFDRASEALDLERVAQAEAKRLVAGGIRFARQNGFKLPPHFERWTAIFGDLGDVGTADLTGFGIDGGLRYVGTMDFLRRRLVACTAEQFLARPDVHFVLGDATPDVLAEDDDLPDLGDDDDEYDEDDEDGEDDEDLELDADGAAAELLDDLRQMVGNTANHVEDAVRKWCFQTGQAPHPRLREALDTLLVSTLPLAIYSNAAEEYPAIADEADVPHPSDLMAQGLVGLPPDERQSIEEAMAQVDAYMRQFKSPREMLAALHADVPPPLPPS